MLLGALYGSRCQVLYIFVLNYLKQFVKTDTRHENLTIALKNDASRELLSLWVLKIPFLKENVKHLQIEIVKQTLSNLRSRNFAACLCYQQHCNVTVEITDTKCGLLSKHLFQRTQQQGGFNKPLRNDINLYKVCKFICINCINLYY